LGEITKRGGKIYIACDLEGTAGVVDHRQQCWFDGEYYQQARRLATLELNAAVEGALEGGAAEVWAWDGHADFPGGIDVELLHPACKLVMNAGDRGPVGFDESFAALFMIGLHGMYGAKEGVLAHSFDRNGNAQWINGLPAGEIGVTANLLGGAGIPFVMISGDQAAADEAKDLVPDIEVAVVKWGLAEKGFKEGIINRGVITLSPEQARREIKAAAKRAMAMIGKIRSFSYEKPYRVRVQYHSKEEADKARQQPGAIGVDDLTVESPPTKEFPF
jgi:D-amino peptidase